MNNILKLSSGTEIDANRGLISLSPGPKFEMGEGYDGPLYSFEEKREWDEDLTPNGEFLNRADRIELCDVMIARWLAYKTKMEAEQ